MVLERSNNLCESLKTAKWLITLMLTFPIMTGMRQRASGTVAHCSVCGQQPGVALGLRLGGFGHPAPLKIKKKSCSLVRLSNHSLALNRRVNVELTR